ncbi:MAG: hypothetical protein EXS36_09715 [Pedosphaera sp.]|nr:hypothetical protein [Pedosphaera sp.]
MHWHSPHLLLLSILLAGSVRGAVPDVPFWQEASVKFTRSPELTNAILRKLCIDQDGVAYVLTDLGVARVHGNRLVRDRNFRPLADTVPRDITLSPAGELYYLLDDVWLSNADAGKPRGTVPRGLYDSIAVGYDGVIWLAGPGRLAAVHNDRLKMLPVPPTVRQWRLLPDARGFFFVADEELGAFLPGDRSQWNRPIQSGATLAARDGELLVGGVAGYFGVQISNGESSTPLQTNLPVTDITCLRVAANGLWVGTARGVFFEAATAGDPTNAAMAMPLLGETRFRYFAGRRWLPDDFVVDLTVNPTGDVWVLTRTGLSKIEFRMTTLEAKVAEFESKIRSRHIRYGFSAERRLSVPGDVASGEMIDTDNDGGWSSYWLASQALRYAVTKEPQAKRWAWETFAALERQQSIHTNRGFPARTFERTGFKVSDVDRWHPSPETGWDWKAHTSSDEIASHMFAYAVLWECATETPAEKQRIIAVVDQIADHIVRNNLYLVDVDGKPTLWGRWHPDYVNRFPPAAYDRRLNSGELTATLQFAYALTKKESYRQKAIDLFDHHGYLTNIVSSMRLLKPTLGLVHQGITMGDTWNHSDDELGFVTYWVLCRFPFTEQLATLYQQSVADHWEFEKVERYPFWNFVTAGCGLPDFDAAGAVWTLRGWPLDTVSWRVENAHRKDLTKMPDNFRGQETVELLPPGERPVMRCNRHPFVLNGGDGGQTEYAGDEYVLGYWLGRFVNAIGSPTAGR